MNTGGPAFPTDSLDDYGHVNGWSSGMTLRDYFAAKAMQAALMTAVPAQNHGLDDIIREASSAAFRVADAMLKAREA